MKLRFSPIALEFLHKPGMQILITTLHTIGIEVEAGTDVTNLVSTFTLSDGATAKVGPVTQVSGITENDFTSIVTYSVTAEDGTTKQNWTVTVSIAANDETRFLSFSFGIPPQTGSATISAVMHTINVRVESGTDVTSLAPTFTLSNGASAKVNGATQSSGVTANNYTNAVTYTITAEDGTTTQEWVVTVTKVSELSNETEVVTYSFGAPPQTSSSVINSTLHTVDIEVEYGTDITNLIATFLISEEAIAKVESTIQLSGTSANDFSGPVILRVTAEDGVTSQNWTINVSVAPNTETEIVEFGFGMPPQTSDATIDTENHTIEIEVERGTDVTNLMAEFMISEGAMAKIVEVEQMSGTTENDFTNAVTYTVVAEDGTTMQNWIITVMQAPNDETDILTFGFATPPQNGETVIDTENHTIEIKVDNGTDLSSLIGMFTFSDGATAKIGDVMQESGITTTDFNEPVVYTVIAEDGVSEMNWTINVSFITGINTYSISDFKVYPNPFSERTRIEFDNPNHKNYNLSVYNISGGKVFEMKDLTSDQVELKRGNLKSGIYIIELKGDEFYGLKKIVVR